MNLPFHSRHAPDEGGRVPDGMGAARKKAAAWYDSNALVLHESGRGALSSLWFKFADRIRNGDADHRLDQVIADQADYDRAEQVPA